MRMSMALGAVAAIAAATVSAPTAVGVGRVVLRRAGRRSGTVSTVTPRCIRSVMRCATSRWPSPPNSWTTPSRDPWCATYLTNLVDNWRRVGVHMAADSFGEGNYQIFRHGTRMSVVIPRDLSRGRAGLQQRLSHLHLRYVRRQAVAAVGPDRSPASIRSTAIPPLADPFVVQALDQAPPPHQAGYLPVRGGPVDAGQGVFGGL